MSAKKISLLALFIALSVIGASIKIPAVIGSVALDAFPALLASVLIGGVPGAIIAGFGHLISAFIGGMPLGPAHIIVAIEMAAIVWGYSLIYKSGRRLLAGLFFVIFNGLVASLPFIFLMSVSFYLAIIPSLVIGATFNAVVAWLFIPRLVAFFDTRIEKVMR